jgi:hypothetical protein
VSHIGTLIITVHHTRMSMPLTSEETLPHSPAHASFVTSFVTSPLRVVYVHVLV